MDTGNMHKSLVKIAHVVPEITSWTDRHTDRHTHHNTSQLWETAPTGRVIIPPGFSELHCVPKTPHLCLAITCPSTKVIIPIFLKPKQKKTTTRKQAANSVTSALYKWPLIMESRWVLRRFLTRFRMTTPSSQMLGSISVSWNSGLMTVDSAKPLYFCKS